MNMTDIKANTSYWAWVGKQPPRKTKVRTQYIYKDGRWCVITTHTKETCLVKADHFIEALEAPTRAS